MDILIKGMEMKDYPQSITINPDGSVVKDTFGLHRPMDEWKAVALPEHHGRLVSAEDFIDSFEDIINECRRQLSEKGEDITVLNYFHDTIVELMGYIPTVLEATE